VVTIDCYTKKDALSCTHLINLRDTEKDWHLSPITTTTQQTRFLKDAPKRPTQPKKKAKINSCLELSSLLTSSLGRLVD
jgi:hypothetical protein